MPNYQIIGRDGRSRFVDLRGDEDVTKVLEDGERLFVPHQFMDAVPSDPYEVTDAMLNEIENAHQEMVEVHFQSVEVEGQEARHAAIRRGGRG